ncbi:MAG: TetR family transcriptional regulator [Oscillospiraceae bacterium]
MIKPTYYNLPEEKKKRLLFAARKEFSRVSYNEASINKIIKDAEISRGSFYTYFDDKSDLVMCLLHEYFKLVIDEVDHTLEEKNGNIFLMFTRLFDVTIEYTYFKNDMELFHSLFRSMRSGMELEGLVLFDEETKNKHLAYIMGKINREALNISNDSEFKDLLDLLLIVTKRSLAKALSKRFTKEEVRESFLYKLSIIKKGVSKP